MPYPQYTLSMPIPSKSENYNLVLSVTRTCVYDKKKVSDETKSEILINLLGEKQSYILLNVSESDLQSIITELLLKKTLRMTIGEYKT